MHLHLRAGSSSHITQKTERIVCLFNLFLKGNNVCDEHLEFRGHAYQIKDVYRDQITKYLDN